MATVQESVDVDVPITVAYNQWTQFESFPQFMSGVESVTQLDDTHTHWVTNVDGVKREFQAEITEQHPDERIAWTSTGGDTKQAGVVTFHALSDDRTRVVLQLDVDPQGFAETVAAKGGMVEDRQLFVPLFFRLLNAALDVANCFEIFHELHAIARAE